MSEAFSGHQSFGSTNSTREDQERLANLKRAIESIEKRVAGAAPQPPHAAPQPPYAAPSAPTGPSLAELQNQINRLTGQMPSPQPAANNMQAAIAEVAARQSMLNASSPRTAPAQPDQATYKGMEAIGRHLGDLKRELAGLKQKVMQPEPIRVPQTEIDRIANAIGDLQRADTFDEAAFQRLTGEIEQLRGVVKQDVKHAIRSELAGTKEIEEQRLISVNKRLDELSKGLDAIGLHATNDMAPRVDNLAGQLDAMRTSIDDLPQKIALERLEQRLGEVAEKLEYTMLAVAESIPSPDQAVVVPENIETIERRLDEISRALVAVSNMGSASQPEIDLSAVERVEARMVDLARAVDMILTDSSKSSAGPELNELTQRIEGLSGQIASFEQHAKSGDLGAASAMMGASDISIIEEQLHKLNKRFEQTSAETQSVDLQQQIERLHSRIEEAANVNSTAAQMSNLEAQIGQILRQMDRQQPGQIAVDLSPMEARLGQIESHILNAQSFSLEAAQQAAQQAVAMMGPQSEQGQLVNALSEDLRALQNIAEQGSAVNAQSVLAVQETLAQVVDRLASIEDTIDEGIPAQNAAAAMHVANIEQSAAQTMQAAHRLEEIALEETAPIQAAATDSGFTVATDADLYGAAGSVTAPPLDPAAHIEASMAHAMTAEENMPLEPGSLAPDLDQLVETASAALNQQQQTAPVAPPVRSAQANVVDAARRAVKHAESEIAAAREAETRTANPAGESLRAKLTGLKPGTKFDFQKFRKPVVLAAAAVLIALIGFKGYQMIATGDVEPTQIEASVSGNQPAMEDKSLASDETMAEDGETIAGDSIAMTDAGSTVREIADEGFVQPPVEAQPETLQDAMEDVAEADAADESATDTEEVALAESANAPATAPASEKTDAERLPENDPPVISAPASYNVPAKAGTVALVTAAENGDPKALFQIGMRYSEGNGVKRNMKASANWFAHAAEQGFAPAQYSLGSLYEKGIGVDRDLEKSTGLYAQAAEQGNARAMHNLAVIRATGNPPSVKPDMDTAVSWFKQAANLGIKDSQFNLGILYGQGMGVPQNLAESYKWFALAAKTGDSDAAGKRDEVANAMDPEDLAAARKEVTAWKVTSINEAANRVEVPEEWRGTAKATTSASVPQSQQQLVQKAQAMLNERGFSVGTPDGLMGPATRKAISEFQRSAGIPVTGKVDGNLLKALDIQV